MKTSFYRSGSVQVKSIKDWNNLIDKIHSSNALRLLKKEKIPSSKKIPDKTTLITILDNVNYYYLSALI